MPIFEYQCQECAKQFEVLVRSKDADKTPTCPSCTSNKTQKKISKSSFSLKGGGWASDGYGS